MRVAVLREGRLVVLDNEPWPVVRSGELLVRVIAAGCTLPEPELVGAGAGSLGSAFSGEVMQLGPDADTDSAASPADLAVGDTVIVLLPGDHPHGPLAEYCTAPVWSCVKLPKETDRTHVAAAAVPAVLAYSALHYGARLAAGESVLICNGATPLGHVAAQLAHAWGAKVIATASTIAEAMYLKSLPAVAHTLDLSDRSVQFLERCAELTHGVGFDVILETAGLGDYRDLQRLKPSKEDLLMALGSHGTLATRVSDLEFSAKDTQCLHLKGASVTYISLAAWTMASSQQGRLLHILADVAKKIEKGEVRVNIAEIVSFDTLQARLDAPPSVGALVLRPVVH